MGHSLRPDNLTITPDFVISDGTHNTGYVLISATGGVASWKDTSNLPGFKTNHYVGELWGGGVVAAVWKENDVEKCLIASLCDFSFITSSFEDNFPTTQYTWSNVTTTISSATSSYDGLANSDYILAQPLASRSHAAGRCLDYINPDYGTGTFSNWYLPSVTEMQQVANNSFKINYAINKYAIDNNKNSYPWDNSNQFVSYISKYRPRNGSFFNITPTANFYWTSTEVMNSGGSQAYSINIVNNIPVKRSKSLSSTIRPVRIASETTIITNYLVKSTGIPTYNIILNSTISGSGDAIVEVGACWNGPYSLSAGYGTGTDELKIPLPTISNNKVVEPMIYDSNLGFGYGELESLISPFSNNAMYSIRAYVINNKGEIKYGEQLVFN